MRRNSSVPCKMAAGERHRCSVCSKQCIAQTNIDYEPLVSRYDELVFEPHSSGTWYLSALSRVYHWLLLGYALYPKAQSLLSRTSGLCTLIKKFGQCAVKPPTAAPGVYFVIFVSFLVFASAMWTWRLFYHSYIGLVVRLLIIPVRMILPAIQGILGLLVLTG